MKTVAIIQARLGSTRLPAKVLRDVAGETMLTRVVNSVRRSKLVDQVVVATSNLPIDESLVRYCKDHQYDVVTGSHLDVLSRYVIAAKKYDADAIVRITADCPLIDPGVVDQVVTHLTNDNSLDYVCNFHPQRKYPRGLDAEAFTRETLTLANRMARASDEREHVTLQIYRNPAMYRIGSVAPRNDFSHLRWTVDTADDLRLVNEIYRHFGDRTFRWRDVIAAYADHPHWRTINDTIEQKKVA